MNTEKHLYLALKNLCNVIDDNEIIEHCPSRTGELLYAYKGAAENAMQRFELELGPLPDWATAHNIAQEPVTYAQLFTRNPRRNGNAMIYHVGASGGTFGVITDMGNTMVLNATELDQLFEVGDYIMNETAYEKRKRQRDDYIPPLEHD